MAILVGLLIVLSCLLPSTLDAQTADRSGMSGEQLYQSACLACHGADGKGQPLALRGFALEPLDFTDCNLTTPEANLDWQSIIRMGGPIRAFAAMMPAFGDELSSEEVGKVIEYVRGFCSERGWPHGDLNMPRPLVTEKAFPENEAVLTTGVVSGRQQSMTNEFLYERRLGRRGQYEIIVPLRLQQGASGGAWNLGVGDIGAAYKHVLFDSESHGAIVSAGGEVKLPTGSQSRGLGGGVTVFEGFATYSQALPFTADGFLHAHAGLESPSDTHRAPREAFWRLAIGKSYMQRRWGRAWSPMVEILGAREIADAAGSEWDVVPQMQVSLSTRQHVLLNVGVRMPISQGASRQPAVLMYLLWDWFDGSFFSGW